MNHFIKHFLPLIILLSLLGIAIYFQWYSYLSFESLKNHRQILLLWNKDHFGWVLLCFMAIYILVVACSIPGAMFLTLSAGFLFGPIIGLSVTIISATLGALIVFIAVQLALRDWVEKRTAHWVKKMEKGFKQNAFSYLLFLRLVPLFPFWLVNIVPALLGVSTRTFILATVIGMIPGSFVYVMLGNSLGYIFDTHQSPNLNIIFDPKVFLPLLALALLSLLPVIYKFIKGKST